MLGYHRHIIFIRDCSRIRRITSNARSIVDLSIVHVFLRYSIATGQGIALTRCHGWIAFIQAYQWIRHIHISQGDISCVGNHYCISDQVSCFIVSGYIGSFSQLDFTLLNSIDGHIITIFYYFILWIQSRHTSGIIDLSVIHICLSDRVREVFRKTCSRSQSINRLICSSQWIGHFQRIQRYISGIGDSYRIDDYFTRSRIGGFVCLFHQIYSWRLSCFYHYRIIILHDFPSRCLTSSTSCIFYLTYIYIALIHSIHSGVGSAFSRSQCLNSFRQSCQRI